MIYAVRSIRSDNIVIVHMQIADYNMLQTTSAIYSDDS